jgi:hypothetical protein
MGRANRTPHRTTCCHLHRPPDAPSCPHLVLVQEAITAYYRAKRADIERTCDAWVAESTLSRAHKGSMESTTADIKHALARLAP